jgi:hypothetical protein
MDPWQNPFARLLPAKFSTRRQTKTNTRKRVGEVGEEELVKMVGGGGGDP